MALHAPITSVMAYNVSFDQKMMERTFPAAAYLPWGPCLMKAAAQHVGGNRGRIKLSEAMKKLNVSVNPSAHRALFDAQAAAKVWEAVAFGAS
jgi:DNA polymerase III epsilon subunit-like protein